MYRNPYYSLDSCLRRNDKMGSGITIEMTGRDAFSSREWKKWLGWILAEVKSHE